MYLYISCGGHTYIDFYTQNQLEHSVNCAFAFQRRRSTVPKINEYYTLFSYFLICSVLIILLHKTFTNNTNRYLINIIRMILVEIDVVPLFEFGDSKLCGNYSPIALTLTTFIKNI